MDASLEAGSSSSEEELGEQERRSSGVGVTSSYGGSSQLARDLVISKKGSGSTATWSMIARDRRAQNGGRHQRRGDDLNDRDLQAKSSNALI